MAELYGWDTVTTLPVAEVDRMLAEREKELIRDFTFKGEILGAAYDGSGVLSPWRILPGDPGDLLRLALPIEAGTVRTSTGAEIGLAGLEAVVMVSLALLPSDTERIRRLVFAFRRAGKAGDAPVPGIVTPVALTGPAAILDRLGELGRDAVLDGIAGHLVARAAELSFAFAEIDIAPPGEGGWLTPFRSAYSYVRATGSGDAGHLAVLSVTGDRDIAGLPHEVDPGLPAAGAEVSYAVSRELFLTNVVLPGLPEMFGGEASVGDFAYDPRTREIRNVAEFKMRSIKEGAIWYAPRVTSLSVGLAGQELTVSVEGDCDLGAGISMTYWTSGQARMVFDRASATIAFVSVGEPRGGHEADIPLWFILGGPLAEAITQIVVIVIGDGIAGVLGSRSGVGGLGGWPARSVRWGGSRSIAVEHAVLDGCLLVKGRPA